ncbi:DUF1963 domain-containing protein [Primorskyibacter sp. 2E107]|uniref:DUF1963 domain-containing protein n=1 Tax=Primorskyibacter sp. 2E107 TaxID=3403458 RepID=UPI003AF4C9F4
MFPLIEYPAKLADPAEHHRALDPGELEQMLAKATYPALFLVKEPFAEMPARTGCWLGGAPTLPPEIAWPWVARYTEEATHPMHFIAQINLASLPFGEDFELMPRTGTLFFFADYADHLEGVPGTASVIWVDGDVSACPERAMPDFPEGWKERTLLDVCWFEEPKVFRKWPVHFHKFDQIAWMFVGQDFADAMLERVMATDKTLNDLAIAPVPDLDRSGLETERSMPARHTLFDFYGDRDEHLMMARQIPLLRLEYDHDWGFDYSEHLAFYIDSEALKARDFSRAFAWTII